MVREWGRGVEQISLFLLFRCYSVTNSWKPLPIQDFSRNRIRNTALRLRYKTTGHGVCFAIFGRFAGKNLEYPSSSRTAVTSLVTTSVTAILAILVAKDGEGDLPPHPAANPPPGGLSLRRLLA